MTTLSGQTVRGSLTRYPSGSLREAWNLILPMVLTSTSMSLMLFFDRLIVAQYSTKAMNAVASAGMVVVAFEFTFMAIANIAETFVGQHNGAQDYKRVAEPVWQMIWFSLSTVVIAVPVALYGAEFFVAGPFDELGVPYFKNLMLFSPLMPLFGAFGSFFIGLGKAKIVTFVTVFGNALNIALDYLLILGVDGWIDPMGTKGAAVATNIALGLQCLILGYLFLGKQYREKYGTYDFRLKLRPLLECLRIGSPSAISHMIELGAWAVQMNLMALVGEIHITVMAIGQSIFLLFVFISDGMSKGMGAIAANYMGAKEYQIIPKSFLACVKLHLIMMSFVLVVFTFFHDPLINLLIEGDYPPAALNEIIHFSKWALVWVWCFLLVDGITWIIVGILTAAGDTSFIMGANGFNAWFFGVVPLYIWVVKFGGSPAVAWFQIAFYASVNLGSFWWRYKSGSWKINRVRRI